MAVSVPPFTDCGHGRAAGLLSGHEPELPFPAEVSPQSFNEVKRPH